MYERKANELSVIGGNVHIHTYHYTLFGAKSPIPDTHRAMLIYEEMVKNFETMYNANFKTKTKRH